MPASARVLEVGCGNGNVASFLKKYGRPVDCGDLFANGLAHCRKRSAGNNYFQFNLYDPVFYHEYDCICAFDVIEHIDDDALVLRNMGDALKDGGIVFITVPANQSLWSPSDVYANHKRRYDPGDLRKKIEAAGFKVLKLSYYNSLLYPFIVLFRKAKKALGREDKKLSTQIPINPVINELFYRIFCLERHLLTRRDMPFGNSLICIALRPHGRSS